VRPTIDQEKKWPAKVLALSTYNRIFCMPITRVGKPIRASYAHAAYTPSLEIRTTVRRTRRTVVLYLLRT
jgi:hypothetical protein